MNCCSCDVSLGPNDTFHLFECRHRLCAKCLEGFSDSTLRSVCFTCATPESNINDPWTKTHRKEEGSSKDRSYATSSIVNEAKQKQKTSTTPSYIIYNRPQFSDDIGGESSSVLDFDSGAGACKYRKGTPSGGTLNSDDICRKMETSSTDRCRGPKKLSAFAQSLRKMNNEAVENEKEFERRVDDAKRKIENHARMCKALIDRDQEKLLQELEVVRQGMLSDSSVAIGKVENLIEKLERASKETDEGKVEQLLSARVEKVQFKEFDITLNNIQPPNEQNVVGELSVRTITEISCFLPTPVHIGTLPRSSGAVTGITVLDSELFIVQDESHNISVHQVVSCKFIRHLSLSYLLQPTNNPSPTDLAACPKNRCLYVADRNNPYVYRLRPEDGHLLHWWQVENLAGLSVTSCGNVLVGSGKKIREYDVEGKIVRNISPNWLTTLQKESPKMRKPRHFLELDSGQVVVCDFQDEQSPHVVYEIDRKGNITSCHGNKAEAGEEGCNEPRHLAITISGHVLVADHRNKRIKVLDTKLKFVRNLLLDSTDGLSNPMRLYLDNARGHLYVGQSNGDTLVFRVLV